MLGEHAKDFANLVASVAISRAVAVMGGSLESCRKCIEGLDEKEVFEVAYALESMMDEMQKSQPAVDRIMSQRRGGEVEPQPLVFTSLQHFDNAYDHRRDDALLKFSGGAEFERYLDFVRKFVIGPPQATPFYTREQLEEQGMIGLYCGTETK